jgi:hypothetical protein
LLEREKERIFRSEALASALILCGCNMDILKESPASHHQKYAFVTRIYAENQTGVNLKEMYTASLLCVTHLCPSEILSSALIRTQKDDRSSKPYLVRAWKKPRTEILESSIKETMGRTRLEILQGQ